MLRRALIIATVLALSVVGATHAAFLAVSGGRTAVAVPSGGGSGGDAPSWTSSAQVGYWYLLSGSSPDLGLSSTNALSDVVDITAGDADEYGTEGPSATIEGYGGAAISPNYGNYGGYFPWDGGHAAYHGNALFAFDLETRTYARITDSYKSVSFPNSSGVWGDGSPGIPHTLNAWHYHEPTDSLITFNLETSNSYGPIHKPMAYSLTTDAWRVCAQNSNMHPDAIVWAAYDAANDTYWMEGDSGAWGVSRMNGASTCSSSTYTYFDTLGTGDQDMTVVAVPAGEWDTDTALVMARFYSGGTTVRALDVGSTGSGWQTLTQSGRPSVGARNAWEWAPAAGGIIYWNGGENVYLITKGAGTLTSATYTWSLLTDGSNTTAPTYGGGTGGIYSKGRVITWGTQEWLIAHVDYADGVYGFRIQ